MQTNSSIDVQPLSGAVGAEIFGVDLSADLDDRTIADIRGALLAHCVVFFRDQNLQPEVHKALARRFGNIFIHPNLLAKGGDQEIVEIVRRPHDTSIIGEEWHSDTTMMAEPPMGAILFGVEIPPYGGDTIFSNQYLAYEALSPTMKGLLENLRGIHSDRRVAGPMAARNAVRSTKTREDSAWCETVSMHPVAKIHPETGRKALFVNHSYTVGIEGMSEAESRSLLDFLFEQGHRPEFTCRFRWRAGSVAFWDNRCTKHLAINDTGAFGRVMRRVQIA